MAEIKWWKVPDQSLAVAVRDAGFDLAVYEDYRSQTKEEVKSRGITEALWRLNEDFKEIARGKSLRDIKKGVYVICTSRPFTISYDEKYSDIIYIGRGNIYNRIKRHFEKSLFAFMESLSGTNFDFYFCEPRRRNSPNFYKHVEHLLLQEFKDKIGGGSYPLLNKNAGANYGLRTPADGWNTPLKNTGRRPLWALEFQRKDFRGFILDE